MTIEPFPDTYPGKARPNRGTNAPPGGFAQLSLTEMS
jgi:hypothetical protein